MATYTYYHNGLRKSKTVGGVITNYDWDDFDRLVRESDSIGNTIASYYYDSKGNLVGLKKNNVTYIYHTNLRGDIVSVADYNGNIVAQYNYDPWGNQTSYSGTLVQPFRYAGYYTDDETGLNYLKSRYYSPQLGRFLTKDKYKYIDKKNPQTLNLYSYCGNNPVSNVDPSDKWTLTINGVSLTIPDGASVSIGKVASGAADIASKVLGVAGGVIISIFVNARPVSDQDWDPYYAERGLPPDGITPPGYDSDWTTGDASRPSEVEKGGKSTYDPSGGEWRYSPEDKYHNPHWDYNPHSAPNSPWENVPLNPGDKIYK